MSPAFLGFERGAGAGVGPRADGRRAGTGFRRWGRKCLRGVYCAGFGGSSLWARGLGRGVVGGNRAGSALKPRQNRARSARRAPFSKPPVSERTLALRLARRTPFAVG